MRRRILKALVREGALSEQQVEAALQLETETGQSFDHIIRDKGWVTEEKLLTVIHRKTLWPFERSLASYVVPKEFVENVELSLARQHNLVALGVDEEGVYRIATCEPFNYHSMDLIATQLETEVQLIGRARKDAPAVSEGGAP